MRCVLYIWNDLTTIILLGIILGFSAIWGTLLNKTYRKFIWSTILFGFFLYFPIILSVPWGIPGKISVGILSGLLIIIYVTRPLYFPLWLWQRHFTYIYFGILMLFIIVWVIVSKEPLLWFGLGSPALFACLLVTKRIINNVKNKPDVSSM